MKHFLRLQGAIFYVLIIALNAMTDLGHKIILQNTIFKSYDGADLIMLTALVNALILLPFIFLFSPAGYMSDRYAKTKVIEYSALFAIGVTLLITLSYSMGWFWVSFGLTFILAAQSAIYSPAKYGLIKEMSGNEALAGANAVVQAITIVSILVAGVVFSLVFETLLLERSQVPSEILPYIAPVGILLIVMSSIEYFFARKLSKRLDLKPHQGHESFSFSDYKNLTYLRQNLSIMRADKVVWLSILGLSLIWGVAQVVLALFGEYLKRKLGITDTVTAQLLLALFGVGMILGSIFAGRVSRESIEKGIIPLGALGVTVALYLLPQLESLVGLGVTLFVFGFTAAMVMIPLNAMIQFFTPIGVLGKVLAGNNFMQNVSMFLFLFLTALFGYFALSSTLLFYGIFGMAFIGMIYAFKRFPQSVVRYVLGGVLRLRYRLVVEGLSHIPSDKGVLLLGNHISYLDWAILQMAYPKQIRFVMQRHYYEKWYLKPFFKFFGTIPISSKGSKSALYRVTEALNAGETVAMFPEGHLSRNGHLGLFQKGFERATKGVEHGVIVPFYLHGLWEGRYSYASEKMKRKRNRHLRVHFGSPIPIESEAKAVKRAVFQLSISSWEAYANALPSLQEAWIKASKARGKALSIADSTGVRLSGYRLMTGVFMIAKHLKSRLKKEQNIGVILPTSAAGSMGNMALLSLAKTIVNLNYSSGTQSLLYALQKAEIRTVISSRQFVSKLKAKGFDLTEVLAQVEVIYLEDVKQRMNKLSMLWVLLQVMILPTQLLRLCYVKRSDSSDTAAILFSSGSEGRPKGIALSHKNMMANIKQITTLLNPTDRDVMLGTLPIFHSFGLTVTTLLPLVEEVPVVCHPDPTDGLGIGKIAAAYHGTILFATGTFLRLYTRNSKLHPLMFSDLRFVIAGAEKLSTEVRDAFTNKFNVEIYEGYGATETSPVAATNIADVLMTDHWKVQKGNHLGSVGLPIPGTTFKIVDPETLTPLDEGEAGMILIGGPQVMQGYIGDSNKTQSVLKEIDGIEWYVTGDKGTMDQDGFLTIVDRYSRFAKIGGEMVSLGLVEQEISKLLDEESQIAITALPDTKKGEKLILLFEGKGMERLQEKIKSIGLNPLYLPSEYIHVATIPKLGTGKSDFNGVKKLALSCLEK